MLLEEYVALSLLENVRNLLCFAYIVLELIIIAGNCLQTVLFYQIDVRLIRLRIRRQMFTAIITGTRLSCSRECIYWYVEVYSIMCAQGELLGYSNLLMQGHFWMKRDFINGKLLATTVVIVGIVT